MDKTRVTHGVVHVHPDLLGNHPELVPLHGQTFRMPPMCDCGKDHTGNMLRIINGDLWVMVPAGKVDNGMSVVVQRWEINP